MILTSILSVVMGCVRSDPSDEWTYDNQTASPNTDFNDDDGGGGSADDSDTGSSSSDTGDTGDAGDTASEQADPPTEGTGYSVGDVAHNLSGTNHLGQPWSLYDHYGERPVVLLVGHMDLGSSMTTPMGIIGGVGAVSVALVGRSEISTAATADDTARYATKYGIDSVLNDPSYSDVALWSDSAPPKAYVIDQQMSIVWVGFGGAISESAVEAALQGR